MEERLNYKREAYRLSIRRTHIQKKLEVNRRKFKVLDLQAESDRINSLKVSLRLLFEAFMKEDHSRAHSILINFNQFNDLLRQSGKAKQVLAEEQVFKLVFEYAMSLDETTEPYYLEALDIMSSHAERDYNFRLKERLNIGCLFLQLDNRTWRGTVWNILTNLLDITEIESEVLQQMRTSNLQLNLQIVIKEFTIKKLNGGQSELVAFVRLLAAYVNKAEFNNLPLNYSFVKACSGFTLLLISVKFGPENQAESMRILDGLFYQIIINLLAASTVTESELSPLFDIIFDPTLIQSHAMMQLIMRLSYKNHWFSLSHLPLHFVERIQETSPQNVVTFGICQAIHNCLINSQSQPENGTQLRQLLRQLESRYKDYLSLGSKQVNHLMADILSTAYTDFRDEAMPFMHIFDYLVENNYVEDQWSIDTYNHRHPVI